MYPLPLPLSFSLPPSPLPPPSLSLSLSLSRDSFVLIDAAGDRYRARLALSSSGFLSLLGRLVKLRYFGISSCYVSYRLNLINADTCGLIATLIKFYCCVMGHVDLPGTRGLPRLVIIFVTWNLSHVRYSDFYS